MLLFVFLAFIVCSFVPEGSLGLVNSRRTTVHILATKRPLRKGLGLQSTIQGGHRGPFSSLVHS